MPNQEIQQVTVRRLTEDGTDTASPCASFTHNTNEQMLHLDLEPTSPEPELKTGDLVEVTSPEYLYLGEIVMRQAGTVVVSVEHKVDREVLAAIQQVWRAPGTD